MFFCVFGVCVECAFAALLRLRLRHNTLYIHSSLNTWLAINANTHKHKHVKHIHNIDQHRQAHTSQGRQKNPTNPPFFSPYTRTRPVRACLHVHIKWQTYFVSIGAETKLLSPPPVPFTPSDSLSRGTHAGFIYIYMKRNLLARWLTLSGCFCSTDTQQHAELMLLPTMRCRH